jgi:hypothetical protein
MRHLTRVRSSYRGGRPIGRQLGKSLGDPVRSPACRPALTIKELAKAIKDDTGEVVGEKQLRTAMERARAGTAQRFAKTADVPYKWSLARPGN